MSQDSTTVSLDTHIFLSQLFVTSGPAALLQIKKAEFVYEQEGLPSRHIISLHVERNQGDPCPSYHSELIRDGGTSGRTHCQVGHKSHQ